MTDFVDAYYKASRDFLGVTGALESAGFVNDVQVSIGAALEALKKEAERRANVGVDYVKGNIAEVWHAETLKVSAVAKGNDDIWANAVGNNKTGQDVAYGNSTTASHAELKYYKTAEDSARQLGNPAYSDSQKIVPTDQLEGVIAESQKQAARNQDIRPEVAAAYQDTADTVSDRIEADGITSKPLSEGDAKSIASDFKRDGEIDPDAYGLNTESFIEWSDIFRESGSAALNAAAFSAALTAAPHVYRIVAQYVQSGQLDARLIREGASQVLGVFQVSCHLFCVTQPVLFQLLLQGSGSRRQRAGSHAPGVSPSVWGWPAWPLQAPPGGGPARHCPGPGGAAAA